MLFRRAKKETAEAAVMAITLPLDVISASITTASGPETVSEVTSLIDVNEDADADADAVAVGEQSTSFDFSTTDDLEANGTWLGQEHVANAITSVLESQTPGINMCVAAPPGFGAAGEIVKLLKAHAALKPAAADWVYVHNFDDARRPIALRLAPGGGRRLAEGMLEVLSELCVTVPAALESDVFKARSRLIVDGHRVSSDATLATLQHKAAGQNVALLRTPNGYGFAPVHEGKVVKPAVFAQLPQAMRSDIEARITTLQSELVAILAQAPQSNRAQHKDKMELRASHAQRAIVAAFEELDRDFSDLPETLSYLANAKASLVRNCDVFMPGSSSRDASSRDASSRDASSRDGCEPGPVAIAHDPRFQRYLVNVIVSQPPGSVSAPVLALAALPRPPSACAIDAPNMSDGAHMGLAPGALHLAHGGILFVMAGDLEHAPQTYRALSQAIRSGEVRVPHPTLQPSPLPLSLTVILLADEAGLQRLQEKDADFLSLFGVSVRCAERLERTGPSEKAFASWIAGLVARDHRLPLTAAAVHALIGDSVRRAAKKGALSLAQDALTQVLAEAHTGALLAEDKVIDAGHIQHVFAQRASRLTRGTGGMAVPA